MQKKVLLKLGSRVLFDDKNQPDTKTIENIAKQIATLTQNEYEVILVSSGAVMTGIFSLSRQNNFSHEYFKDTGKKALAAHGQVCLMALYKDIFEYYHLNIGQVLLNRHDFDEHLSEDIKIVINTLLGANIIPVVNESDPTAHIPTKFTDNDELASFLSKLLEVDLVILLTDVDGLFTGPPSREGSVLVKEVNKSNLDDIANMIDPNLISGRGGMMSKVMNAVSITESGIPVFISNGKTPQILIDIIQNKQHYGTFFPASSNK